MDRMEATHQASDHPRACRELYPHPTVIVPPTDHPRACGELIKPRIIPAHAGNSQSGCVGDRGDSDHPRACGELFHRTSARPLGCGSSPRMRGTPHDPFDGLPGHRIIPAHAGNSLEPARPLPTLTDHPRACGELQGCEVDHDDIPGSSPRMRGTRRDHSAGAGDRRIIPAHAGNSSRVSSGLDCRSDHPSACGELF